MGVPLRVKATMSMLITVGAAAAELTQIALGVRPRSILSLLKGTTNILQKLCEITPEVFTLGIKKSGTVASTDSSSRLKCAAVCDVGAMTTNTDGYRFIFVTTICALRCCSSVFLGTIPAWHDLQITSARAGSVLSISDWHKPHVSPSAAAVSVSSDLNSGV